MYRRLLVSLAILSFTICAAAQRRAHYANLTVHVRLSNEQPAQDQLRVQLLTGGGIVMAESMTHSTGEVEFPLLIAGDYRLRVAGPGIEDTTTGVFTISPMEVSHTEFVAVRLKRSHANERAQPGSGNTISATDLKASKKAVKEYNQGTEALARSRWEDARKHFEKAVAIDPQFASAYHNLGVACSHLNDSDNARKAFSTAIRLDPRLTSAYLNLARLEFTLHNFPAVKAVLRNCLSTAPDDPAALTMLSEAELLTREYDAALADAAKVQGPQFAIVHYVAGQALEAQGRATDAAAEYEAFLKEMPNGPEAPRVRAALDRLRQPSH